MNDDYLFVSRVPQSNFPIVLQTQKLPFQHEYAKASIISFQELYGSKGQPCVREEDDRTLVINW